MIRFLRAIGIWMLFLLPIMQGLANSFSLGANPYQYSGQYTDIESRLQYLNARYYQPELQRFITRDSYRLPNRYAYAESNPITNSDPSGHSIQAAVNGISNSLNESTLQNILNSFSAISSLMDAADAMASLKKANIASVEKTGRGALLLSAALNTMGIAFYYAAQNSASPQAQAGLYDSAYGCWIGSGLLQNVSDFALLEHAKKLPHSQSKWLMGNNLLNTAAAILYTPKQQNEQTNVDASINNITFDTTTVIASLASFQ